MPSNTLLADNRIKSALVLLPALAITVWIAAQIGSEDYLVPALVTAAFGGLVIFNAFTKSIRFESSVVCLLLVGYLVGNRGFAEMTLAPPFYPGEVCLAAISAAILIRFVVTREWIDLSGFLSTCIIAFCVLGAIRLAVDFGFYRMEALRDSAMVYYSVYFFCGRQLAQRADSKSMLEKCLRFSFIAIVPLLLVQRLAPDLLESQGEASIFYQRNDLLTTFAACGVFYMYTRPKLYRWAWLQAVLIFFFIAYIAEGFTRASLLGLCFGSIPILVAGRKKYLFYPGAVLLVGVVVLGTLTFVTGPAGDSETDSIVEKLHSMVDFNGTGTYNSDLGDEKSGNNEFRRTLWQSFIDETNAVSPWFGRGFGYDFLAHYEDSYRRGKWEGLRSAHNYYVTLYGRMGIIGTIVFAAITVQMIVGGLRAARAVAAGWLSLADLSYWCSAWAILVAAAVGVVLEGPVGAIVFWSFLGVGTGTLQVAGKELQARLEREAQPVLSLAEMGSNYGCL
jgi:O-antigen ligase